MFTMLLCLSSVTFGYEITITLAIDGYQSYESFPLEVSESTRVDEDLKEKMLCRKSYCIKLFWGYDEMLGNTRTLGDYGVKAGDTIWGEENCKHAPPSCSQRRGVSKRARDISCENGDAGLTYGTATCQEASDMLDDVGLDHCGHHPTVNQHPALSSEAWEAVSKALTSFKEGGNCACMCSARGISDRLARTPLSHLTEDELKKMFPNAGRNLAARYEAPFGMDHIDFAFSQYDTDGNDKLSMDEFYFFWMKHVAPKMLHTLFNDYDENNDHELSKSEFTKYTLTI